MSHSAEKNQKGDPLSSDGFVNYVKKVQNERGDPLETKKLSKESRTVPKKIEKIGRGDSVVPSGFVGYLEKSLHKICLGLFGGLGALGGFRIVSEKWTDQCEAEEKKGHCYSRAFFLKRKTPLLKRS